MLNTQTSAHFMTLERFWKLKELRPAWTKEITSASLWGSLVLGSFMSLLLPFYNQVKKLLLTPCSTKTHMASYRLIPLKQ